MYSDADWLSPYIYAHFVPIEEVRLCKDMLDKALDDEYKLEICTTNQGYYYAIKKSEYEGPCDTIRML